MGQRTSRARAWTLLAVASLLATSACSAGSVTSASGPPPASGTPPTTGPATTGARPTSAPVTADPSAPVRPGRLERPRHVPRILRTVDADCRAALSSPRGVLLVGDSLTVISGEKLATALARKGVPVCIDAMSGRNSQGGNAALSSALASGKVGADATVVMALGANDARKPGGWATCQVTTALAHVGPHRKVVWVNAYTGHTPQTRAATQRFNAEVEALAGQVPRLSVADWHAVAASHPGILLPDDVHPRPAGMTAWADTVSAGVLTALETTPPDQEVAPRCPVSMLPTVR